LNGEGANILTETQKALRGEITPAVEEVAREEGMDPARLRDLVAQGRVVITGTARDVSRVIGIGEGLKTKVNANIGTSPDHSDVDIELEKLRVAIEAGADTIMDLSTGGDIDDTRKRILDASTVPVGTVPIYQAVVEVTRRGGEVEDCSVDDFFRVVEKHAEDGVDFMTIHCGLTRALARRVAAKRVAGVVSRGGSFLLQWMTKNKQENPYYEYFDRLLDIAEKYDVVISLGDGLRPGAIADASDGAQIGELIVIGELVERARKRGVSVMVEGPGHVPLHEIPSNMILQKKICKGAPFYVLGPLVTDVAPGYDHITSAIGGAVAAWYGADFLCYVTPAEHLRLPSIEDVREGVIATRIAADEWDRRLSVARAGLRWDETLSMSIDPVRAREMYDPSAEDSDSLCTMCGMFCAIRGTKRSTEGKPAKS